MNKGHYLVDRTLKADGPAATLLTLAV